METQTAFHIGDRVRHVGQRLQLKLGLGTVAAFAKQLSGPVNFVIVLWDSGCVRDDARRYPQHGWLRIPMRPSEIELVELGRSAGQDLGIATL